MNPRQRRGALFLLAAIMGALVVFFSIAGYVEDVNAQVGDKVTVLVVNRDVPAHAQITPEMVSQRRIPRRWAPSAYLSSEVDLLNKMTLSNLPEGTYLQQGMLVDVPALEEGQREIAILVNVETSVALKIRPDTIVDIYGSFDTEAGPCVANLVANARIIEVGVPGTKPDQDEQGQIEQDPVLPVTFALRPVEAERLIFAASFAEEVRLALLRPGEESKQLADEACGPLKFRSRAPKRKAQTED